MLERQFGPIESMGEWMMNKPVFAGNKYTLLFMMGGWFTSMVGAANPSQIIAFTNDEILFVVMSIADVPA